MDRDQFEDHHRRNPNYLHRRQYPSLPPGGATAIAEAEQSVKPRGRLQFRKDTEDLLRPMLSPDGEDISRVVNVALGRARKRGDL